MKKKFLAILISITAMVVFAFGLSACGNVAFRVNFIVDGAVYSTINTGGNEIIKMPENPTKDEYTFDGWYWDKDTWQNPFTANSLLDAPLSSDMNVYCKWITKIINVESVSLSETKISMHADEEKILTATISPANATDMSIVWESSNSTIATVVGGKVTALRVGTATITATATDGGKIATCNVYVEPILVKSVSLNYTQLTMLYGESKTLTATVLPKNVTENGVKWKSSNASVVTVENGVLNAVGYGNATITVTTIDGNKTATCTVEIIEDKITFNTLTVNGENVYGIVSNTTTTFSFLKEIEEHGNAEYKVYKEITCETLIASKTIALNVGDNTVYILQTVDKAIKQYTVTIRRRPMYTVTFNSNGGAAVESKTIEESFCATEPTTTRTGYTFDKWDYNFNNPIIKDTVITASWKANTDTKYKVQYYLQNLENDNYTLTTTENKTGTTDTLATAEIKTFEHFTYSPSETDSGNIAPDGSTVLKVYYTRNRYTVNVSAMNNKGTVSGAGIYANAQEVTLKATMNAGYSFDGWYEGDKKISSSSTYIFNPTKNISLVGKWKANTNTAYKIEYYLQNLENDEYTLQTDETENKTGTTDTTATAEIKNFEHFTVKNNNVTSNINGNGSTVLKVYYTRNKYTVSVSAMDNKGTVSGAGKYANTQEVTVTAKLNAGYSFDGWYVGNEKVSSNATYKFNPIKNISLVGKWEANTNTAYKVEYYLQNLENDEYTLQTDETENKTGTTDTTATAEIKTFKHFTVKNNNVTGYINGNGSTVLKVYYTRNRYTITFDGNGGTIKSGSSMQIVKYGGSVTEPTFTKTGYTFDKWDKSLTNISENQTITAEWKINQYTLTINFGNGQESKIITQDYNSVIEDISNPTRDGYTFSGYDKTMPTTMPAYDKTITAKWLDIFNLNGGTITGLTYHGKTFIEIVIPEKIDGVTITSIGDSAFYYCSDLTSVTIPNSVTSIGDEAFYYCRSLTSVTIPDSVTSIGNSAFHVCSSLTSITIPDSVTSIGNYAFSYCSKLESVYYTGTIDRWVQISFSSGTSNPLDYAKNLYINNALVTEADITTATKINDYAFCGCNSLTSVTIGNGVTSIGNYAFYYCDNLTSVTIGNGVTSIGNYAFSDCSKLTSVYYTGTIDQWVQISFSSSYSNPLYYAENLYINNALVTEANITTATKINDYAFYGYDNLTSVTIGNSVTSIGNYALSDCRGLTSVTIGNGVTSIGNSAFRNCSKLTYNEYDNAYYLGNDSNPYVVLMKVKSRNISSCTIDKNCKVIYDSAFYVCSSLTSVTIPNSITSIGYKAFYYCSSLTSVTIPNSITSIGYEAFSDCSKLTSVYYTGTIDQWVQISFSNYYSNPLCYAKKLYINNAIVTEANITTATKINAYAFFNYDNLTSVTIGNSVTSIGNYAFEYCSSLTSITIGNSVTSIGNWAFAYCSSLTSVTIGNSVTAIGNYAFYLGNYAFYYCDNLTSVTFENPNGWYVSKSSTATSGTGLTLTNTSTNASYFTIYYDYYWYKK